MTAPSPAEYREAVASLPFRDRMRAYDHHDDALASLRLARWYRRCKPAAWAMISQLEYRAAIRSWRHYKRAVRAAQERIAA